VITVLVKTSKLKWTPTFIQLSTARATSIPSLDEPINTVGFMFDSYRCGETANDPAHRTQSTFATQPASLRRSGAATGYAPQPSRIC
jgi:hypothetical protein